MHWNGSKRPSFGLASDDSERTGKRRKEAKIYRPRFASLYRDTLMSPAFERKIGQAGVLNLLR